MSLPAQGIWHKWGASLKIHSQDNPFRTESWPLPPVLNSDGHSRANIKAGLWSSIESKLKSTMRMSMVIQWLRICLPTRGFRMLWGHWDCAQEPVLLNKRSHHNEKPLHPNKEQPLLATTRESPRSNKRASTAISKLIFKNTFFRIKLTLYSFLKKKSTMSCSAKEKKGAGNEKAHDYISLSSTRWKPVYFHTGDVDSGQNLIFSRIYTLDKINLKLRKMILSS